MTFGCRASKEEWLDMSSSRLRKFERSGEQVEQAIDNVFQSVGVNAVLRSRFGDVKRSNEEAVESVPARRLH